MDSCVACPTGITTPGTLSTSAAACSGEWRALCGAVKRSLLCYPALLNQDAAKSC
jgi:hypothetical protein